MEAFITIQFRRLDTGCRPYAQPEIAANFAATVDITGMSEAGLLQAMREDAENWSDDPQEQMARLLT